MMIPIDSAREQDRVDHGHRRRDGPGGALLFAQEGALVVGCDLKETEAEETVAFVRSAGGEVTSLASLDLSPG
jgi:hypothetical protein